MKRAKKAAALAQLELVRIVSKLTPDRPKAPITVEFSPARGGVFRRVMNRAEADTFELGGYCARHLAEAAGVAYVAPKKG